MQTAPWKTQRIPEKERTARAKRKLAGGDEMKSNVTGKQDARDTLIRLTLEGYGYTFVAKGTEAWVGIIVNL